MKNFLLMILTATGFAAFTMPAAAIELTPKADVKVPSAYATVSGGKILYEKSPTAYSSVTFNKVLEAYGLILKPEAVSGVPTSYAKVSDGKVIFNDTSTAYEPVAYHSIFTAYGLHLSPENVKAKLGAVDYAKVINGKIVFTKVCVAYSGEGFAEILSAYTLPAAITPAPVAAPVPIQPKQVEKKGWTLSSDLLFDFDKATIKAQYYPVLDEIAEELTSDSALRVSIEGHADSTGTNKYNQGLSERRAKAVYTYLMKKNIGASRLTTVGFGEEKPAYPNDTREGRAKNRRVELKPIQ